jgi:beta-galactosidase
MVLSVMAPAWMQAVEPREITPLASWLFTQDIGPSSEPPQQAVWNPVQVPHIFRQSGLPDAGIGWYRTTITWDEADRGRRVMLKLDGAATVTEVFVNGAAIGRHVSAYTAAVFDLTESLVSGRSNRIDVRVSNRDDDTKGVLARSTLYYVNGGMFRTAWLVKTGAVHIYPELGSSGVYLTPQAITNARADLHIRTMVSNAATVEKPVVVVHTVMDPVGKECATATVTGLLAPGAIVPLDAIAAIAEPKRWDLGQPNLYTVKTRVQVDGQISDVLTESTGIRTITYQNQRFQLNGHEVQFRGVNKHAQDEYVWNAVSDETLAWEWTMMADLGINTVRLAHYPHSRFEYDQADRLGLAVWAENGFAGHAWKGAQAEDKAVTAAGEYQTREMVRQNWNHPSILFWSCGNETIVSTADRYAAVIKAEADPNRLVTYAATEADKVGTGPKTCDFVARNTYDGWYGRTYPDFARKPNNSLVSETGCGGWITHHVPPGTATWSVDKYEPEEYSELFTEYRLQTVCRDDVAGRPMFLWWTFREFYNDKFKKNRNTKGLLTLEGMPKDMYYAFQAFMNPGKPMVHLNGRHHVLRRFAADAGIKAYANVPELELTINGVSQGRQRNGGYRLPDLVEKKKDGSTTTHAGIAVANVFVWKTPLAPGRNVIVASDGAGDSDRMVVYQQMGDAPIPTDPNALVQDLHSSNAANPAVFIDRPVEAQGPVYTEVDGSSDNTFDVLPKAIEGAAWIATKRLSDAKLATDLSFRVNPASHGAEVSVLFSTGTFPVVTLIKPDHAIVENAAAMAKQLAAQGFTANPDPAVWRDHELNRADAAVWTRTVKPGEVVTIPARTLDYVILVKSLAP